MPTDGSSLKIERMGKWALVNAQGALGRQAAASLRDTLDVAVADGKVTKIQVDLRGVTELDVCAALVLVRAYNAFVERGLMTLLVSIGTQPEELIQSTGLRRVFPVVTKLSKQLTQPE